MPLLGIIPAPLGFKEELYGKEKGTREEDRDKEKSSDPEKGVA